MFPSESSHCFATVLLYWMCHAIGFVEYIVQIQQIVQLHRFGSFGLFLLLMLSLLVLVFFLISVYSENCSWVQLRDGDFVCVFDCCHNHQQFNKMKMQIGKANWYHFRKLNKIRNLSTENDINPKLPAICSLLLAIQISQSLCCATHNQYNNSFILPIAWATIKRNCMMQIEFSKCEVKIVSKKVGFTILKLRFRINWMTEAVLYILSGFIPLLLVANAMSNEPTIIGRFPSLLLRSILATEIHTHISNRRIIAYRYKELPSTLSHKVLKRMNCEIDIINFSSVYINRNKVTNVRFKKFSMNSGSLCVFEDVSR